MLTKGICMNTSKERLAIFLPGLYDGGAERTLLNLAEGIAAKGYPVDLVLARAEGPYMAEIPDSVRVIDLKAIRVLLCLPALIHYLRTERPAAVLATLHANIVAVWAKRLAGIHHRVVLNEQNTLSSVSNGEKDVRWKLYPALARWFYPWADGITAVSKGVADDLALAANLSPSRIQVIYNPIVTPELLKKSEAHLEDPWFGSGEPPVILGVGRLTSQKAFNVLIDAFALVRKSQAARLLILGEGEERQMLETQIRQLGLEQDVRLPGFVSNPYPYMAHASLFVLSSRWEGLPTVLVEAMALRTPVIATDCPSGPREILRNGEYGPLLPMDDPDTLAVAIRESLTSHTISSSEESWKPYELDTVIDKYISLLLGSPLSMEPQTPRLDHEFA
jgi:glycosyltransferase involved in cell wall biosynthesis